ncbi:hypothetical protein D3C71_1860720 [compost metagenome]
MALLAGRGTTPVPSNTTANESLPGCMWLNGRPEPVSPIGFSLLKQVLRSCRSCEGLISSAIDAPAPDCGDTTPPLSVQAVILSGVSAPDGTGI